MALVATLALLCAAAAAEPVPYARPPPGNRTFRSRAIDELIDALHPLLARGPFGADLANYFANALPNPLDTTVAIADGANDTFVITGDIDAMWLRDSTNQVLPYLPYAADDAPLRAMLCGLVRRQARSVLHDSYANAFNRAWWGPAGPHQADARAPPMTRAVFEGKYELDSLAAFLKLSRGYYEATGDAECLSRAPAAAADALPVGWTWRDAVARALETIAAQRASTADDMTRPGGAPYAFARATSVATDTREEDGHGRPAAAGTGLVKSAFRPSDDATTLPFLVPANAMAVVELNATSRVLEDLARRAARARGGGGARARAAAEAADWRELARAAAELAAGIGGALERYAVLPCPDGGGDGAAAAAGDRGMWAYEVDGFGSAYFMDDANIPSLLSLPYLGFGARDDARYLCTRRHVLRRGGGPHGRGNPFFFAGSAAEGVGGPHVGYGAIWPMAIAVRALTAAPGREGDAEVARALATLLDASAGTGFTHESFNMHNVSDFTRPWFAWANALAGELVLTLVRERPWVVLPQDAIDAAQRVVRRTRA